MNVLIPTLIAVLLAETGGASAHFARLPRLSLAATLLGLAVGVAAFAGVSLAPTMNASARALMLGVALILTGCGQFGRAPSDSLPQSVAGTLRFVWRSGVPLLAFAFAVWKATPLSAAGGALAGLLGAIALGQAPIPPGIMIALRRAAAALLIAVGGYAALWALRLIA